MGTIKIFLIVLANIIFQRFLDLFWFDIGAGVALQKLTGFDEALKAFDKAIEINQQNSKAWDNKSILFK